MNEQFRQEMKDIVQAPDASLNIIEAQLVELVQRWKEQGFEQLEAFDLIHDYRNSTLDTTPDAITDAIDNVLDRIWSWCSPTVRLFPDSMTNEIWDEYKREKPESSQSE